MLNLHRPAFSVAAALVLLSLTRGAAIAKGGPGSGGPLGSVQCGQSYTPGCTVTVGTAAGGTGGTGSSGGTQVATGSPGAGSGCVGTVSKAFGCVPANCTMTVQTLACPVGVGGPPSGGGVPPPGVLARHAVRYLRLPDPVIRSSPSPGALQLTQLPVWLWIAAAAWQPRSKTAQVPGESVTATATPVSAAWSMGDGTTVTCHGPGTSYDGANPAAASPTCGHTYARSSAGQPGGAYRVIVTITWDITWLGPGGVGGVLPPLHTVGVGEFRVAESQALDISGG